MMNHLNAFNLAQPLVQSQFNYGGGNNQQSMNLNFNALPFGQPLVQSQFNYGGGNNQQSMNLGFNTLPFGQPLVQSQVNYGGGNNQQSLNLGFNAPAVPFNIGSVSMPTLPFYPRPVIQPSLPPIMAPISRYGQQFAPQNAYPYTVLSGPVYNYGTLLTNPVYNMPVQNYNPSVPPFPPQQPVNNNNNEALLMGLMLGLMQQMFRNEPQPCPHAMPPFPPEIRQYTETTATNTAGKIWGDPHFAGFEGGRFDVMGKPGGVYNIMSDKNLQFNAQFVGEEGKTYIGTAGIKVGTPESGISRFEFSKDGQAPRMNGKRLAKGEQVTFDTGLLDQNKNRIQGSALWDGKYFTINTGEYVIKLTSQQGRFLNHEVSITNIGVRSDGVATHGLLGQTADFDGKPRNGKTGKGAQGEGAIDGAYTDYEVQSLFSDSFKFNRFGSSPTGSVEFGVGSGQSAATA